jgi:hypothetical protein
MLRTLDTIGLALAATMILGPLAMSPNGSGPSAPDTAKATTPTTDQAANAETSINGNPRPSDALTPNPPADASNAASPAGALVPSPNDRSTSPEQSGARDPSASGPGTGQ